MIVIDLQDAMSLGDDDIESTPSVRLDPRQNWHCLRQSITVDGRSTERTVTFDRNAVAFGEPGVPADAAEAEPLVLFADEFEAVAARVLPADGETGFAVVLELMHADPAYSVPLAVAADHADIVGDWRAWGGYFGLSLAFVESDGVVRIIERRLGAVVTGAVRPRRRSVLNRRRPRFLSRRKPGVVGDPVFVPGVEFPG